MADLKLAKLPDRTPVKITILLPPDLNHRLGAYAELYAERYGAAEPLQALIPAMLGTFLDHDRAFAVRLKKGKA